MIAKKAKLLFSAPAPGTLFAAALDGARGFLYAAGSDGALYCVNVKAEKPALVRKGGLHDNWASSLALGEGGVVSGGFDRKLVWATPEGKKVRAVQAHDGWVRQVVLAPDGKQVVSVGDDMLVRVHDAEGRRLASFSGHEPRTPEGYLSALYALAVSPDGKLAASGDRAGFVRVWELGTGKVVSSFRAAELYTFDARKRARAIGGVRGLAFSPDGARLAASGIGPVTNVDGFVGPCRVELWDWKAAKRVAVGQARHQAVLNHVAFGPGGVVVAAGGGDGGGAIVLWDQAKGAAPVVVKAKGHLHAFALTADGHLHAAGHGEVQGWHLPVG